MNALQTPGFAVVYAKKVCLAIWVRAARETARYKADVSLKKKGANINAVAPFCMVESVRQDQHPTEPAASLIPVANRGAACWPDVGYWEASLRSLPLRCVSLFSVVHRHQRCFHREQSQPLMQKLNRTVPPVIQQPKGALVPGYTSPSMMKPH